MSTKWSYNLHNVLGTVYSGGDLVFTPDGTHVVSLVQNRACVFDLIGATSFTLPFEAQHPLAACDVSSNGSLVACVDQTGHLW